MECLADFDNTMDILTEQEDIPGISIDNFLIYCIYKTVNTQVELFEKTGIVHCDIKSDNVMLRKIHSDEPVEFTTSSIDGKNSKTFSFDEVKYVPVIIDLDCSIKL